MSDAHLAARSVVKESAAMKPESFLPDDYRPAESEPFMNERQLEYFRRKLVTWRQELLDQSAETIDNLQESARSVPDLADRASEETDRALGLRTRGAAAGGNCGSSRSGEEGMTCPLPPPTCDGTAASEYTPRITSPQNNEQNRTQIVSCI